MFFKKLPVFLLTTIEHNIQKEWIVIKIKKRLPFIGQMEHSECGLACLAMLLNYHSHHVTLSELRDEYGSLASGYSFYDIACMANEMGLKSKGYRVDVGGLKQFDLPIILHWNYNHYVILERITKKHFFIVDPSNGRKKYTIQEFSGAFTGNILTAVPTDAFTKKKKQKQNVFLSFLKESKKLLFTLILLTCFLQAVAISIPIITQKFTDKILGATDFNLLASTGAVLLFILLGNLFLSISRSLVIAKFQSSLDVKIMSKFMSVLLRLPYLFFGNRASGDLIFRANSNSLIKQLLSSTTISLFIDVLLVISYMIIMFTYSVPLSLILISISVLIVTVLLVNTRIIKTLSDENVSNQADVQTILADSINGISDIKMLGLENTIFNNWQESFTKEVKTAEKLNIWSGSIQAITSSIQLIVPLSMLWFGSFYLIRGDITIGVLVAFSTISSSFISPIVSLSSSYTQILSIGSYFQRIKDVITSTTEDYSKEFINMELGGEIEFKNVCFKYSKYSNQVVSNVSFKVKKGETVAIVGPSGSGKSTLAKLLLGFYTPTDGEISLDHYKMDKHTRVSLRKQISSVLQESKLFNRTILENITMFQKDIAIEDVIKATKQANIYSDIMSLPMNFHTKISEGGNNLSGGQIQRILIARALIRKTPILVLDEASSALDNISERIVHDSLLELNSTKIIIAHRLSTIKNADKIIVLKEGRIVENGTHETLLQEEGLYYNLYNNMKKKDVQTVG